MCDRARWTCDARAVNLHWALVRKAQSLWGDEVAIAAFHTGPIGVVDTFG
jgi:hypothetical protein